MHAKLLLLLLLAAAAWPPSSASARQSPPDVRDRHRAADEAGTRRAAALRAAPSGAGAAEAVAGLLSAAAPGSAPRGFFASTTYLSYNAAVATDASGGVHLAFYFSDEKHQDAPLGQPAFYTYCSGTTDCSDPANYSALVQLSSTQVNEVQIAATPDGRPRLLVRRSGSRGNDFHYWACDVDCTDAGRWTGLYVVEAMGVELFNADLPQHSFALDGQGRPRFVYSNGWGNGRPNGIYYTYCDAADCTLEGTWEETTISFPVEFKTVTSDYAALVFDGEKPRVLTRYNESGLPVRLDYYACDANCDERSGWARTIIAHPEGKQWANWDLALDAAGTPRIALYEAAGIDIRVGGKLFYGWCEADCSDVNATFRIVQVAGGEGKNVDLTIDAAGRAYLVYDAGQRGILGAMTCDADCRDAGSWQRQILQTSEELQQEFAPASPLTCAQDEQQGRAWLDAVPTTAFDGEGRLVVAYDVKNAAICYYTDPSDPSGPVWTRVERLWWAVRVGFYPMTSEPGAPRAQIGPDRIAFSALAPGQSAERTVSITNTSADRTLTGSVGAAPAPFAVVSGGGAFSLAPGASRAVVVRFAPTAAGAFDGVLSVTHDAANLGSPFAVALSGTAEAAGAVVALRHFDPQDAPHHALVRGGLETNGSVFGTNRYRDRAKGTVLSLPAGVARGTVTAVNAWFAHKRSGLTNETYTLELYDGTAATGPSGAPLYRETHPLADVEADADPATVSGPTHLPLDHPVEVGSTFFVVLDFGAYGEGRVEDVALASTDLLGRRVPEVWERWEDGTWANVSDAWWSETGTNGTDGWHLWVEASVSVGTTTSEEPEPTVPERLVLAQNHPNPFNPRTTIRFELPAALPVEVVVVDALGREVRRLVEGTLPAGAHEVAFDAGGLPSGVYLYRIIAGAASEARRMVLIR